MASWPGAGSEEEEGEERGRTPAAGVSSEGLGLLLKNWTMGVSLNAAYPASACVSGLRSMPFRNWMAFKYFDWMYRSSSLCVARRYSQVRRSATGMSRVLTTGVESNTAETFCVESTGDERLILAVKYFLVWSESSRG